MGLESLGGILLKVEDFLGWTSLRYFSSSYRVTSLNEKTVFLFLRNSQNTRMDSYFLMGESMGSAICLVPITCFPLYNYLDSELSPHPRLQFYHLLYHY